MQNLNLPALECSFVSRLEQRLGGDSSLIQVLVGPTQVVCPLWRTAISHGGTTSVSSDSHVPGCALETTAPTEQRPPWRDDLRVVRLSCAGLRAGNHGADNQAAGRWRGSTSQMARRAQRARREQGKAASSHGGTTSVSSDARRPRLPPSIRQAAPGARESTVLTERCCKSLQKLNSCVDNQILDSNFNM